MSEEIRISVLLHVSQTPYLAVQAVNTVCAQTYPYVQLIVINTNPDNQLAETLKLFKDLDYIHLPNAAESEVYKRFSTKIKGEYITVLHIRDQWYPQHLDLAMECIKMNNLEVFVTNGLVQQKNGSFKNLFESSELSKPAKTSQPDGSILTISNNELSHLICKHPLLFPSGIVLHKNLFSSNLPISGKKGFWELIILSILADEENKSALYENKSWIKRYDPQYFFLPFIQYADQYTSHIIEIVNTYKSCKNNLTRSVRLTYKLNLIKSLLQIAYEYKKKGFMWHGFLLRIKVFAMEPLLIIQHTQNTINKNSKS